jgi:hypothetical protein
MATLTEAVEKSTYVVTVTFQDEAGSAMVPVSCQWSLRDNNGAIVNGRSAVSATAATAISIVLSGDDLVYEPNSQTVRILTVEAVYDGTYGSNLPLKEEFTIPVRNLAGI